MTDINMTVETIASGIAELVSMNSVQTTVMEFQTVLILVFMLLALVIYNRRV